MRECVCGAPDRINRKFVTHSLLNRKILNDLFLFACDSQIAALYSYDSCKFYLWQSYSSSPYTAGSG